MRTSIYLTLKYWRKHKKNAAALMFAGVLLTAVVFVTLMSYREKFVRRCHDSFDGGGHYDLMIVNSDDELISEVLNYENGYRKNYNYSFINVYGKIGTDDKQFTYGVLNDERNLMHIPLQEGRLPETDTELAATVQALGKFFWVGKCGDTITLEGQTYTVVGIIDAMYDDARQGVDDDLYKWFQGNDNDVYVTPYRLPSIFVGQCDKEPQYRIDLFNNFWINSYEVRGHYGWESWGYDTEYAEYVREVLNSETTRWFKFNSEENIYKYIGNGVEDSFFLIIAGFGAAIAVLSVYSILKSVFAERRGRIETLKNIGMSKRSVGCMYAVECAAFTLIQTVIGIVLGLGVYGVMFLFKTSVLREKPYSAFTDIRWVFKQTFDPFLSAFIISAAIMVIAYLINALTTKVRKKTPKKGAKPRSLFRCFGRAFRQTGVSVVQTFALTLICFSVIMGYMYTTDNGKTSLYVGGYYPTETTYYAGRIEMTKNNIEEYYRSSPPSVSTIGHMNYDSSHAFPFVDVLRSRGIDDSVDAQLPDNTFVTGHITHTFIASDVNKGSGNWIDMSNEVVQDTLLGNSSEEYQDFFEEGNIGSKNMHRVDTKLTPARSIETLSEYVIEGEINIDAINRGEEILVTFKGGVKPPFKIGETTTLCSAAAPANGVGIGELNTAEVKIGAILQIHPTKIDEVRYYTVRSEQDYNFLTTATGAEAMGLHCACYTEIFSPEPMNGGVIPLSAEMTVQSLTKMKWDKVKNKILNVSGMILTLTLMALMGFAAYFNGIGMKIRARSYEVSVLRAVGTPVAKLRKRLMINSIKIPVIASALSYGLVKFVQLFMYKVYDYYLQHMLFLNYQNGGDGGELGNGIDYQSDLGDFLAEHIFRDRNMWQVNAEIPALILFAVICTVTFILTAIALKKFRGNIAGDLNDGRTRL